VSVMVSDYVTFKKAGGKWTPKTTSQLTNLFRVMTECLGDKPVREVTKDHMRVLYRLMPQLPAHAPEIATRLELPYSTVHRLARAG
jgi:hypothetical protein